jgi:glycosyltransferase involved in cell wall biosynthesis
MTRPLRVLQVIGGLGVGGAETWLMAVLRRWSANGIGTMDFLLTGGRIEHFDAEAARLGARLHYLPYGRAHLHQFVSAYRRLLREGAYDAIHDHADYAGGWRLAMGAGLLPLVRVAHIHNPWLHIAANYAVSPGRRLATLGGKALVRAFATDVCGTSGEILKQYGFQPGGNSPRVEVVHCGFEIDRFSQVRDEDRGQVLAEFGWPSSTKLVLFAGRMDRSLEISHPQNHKNSWLALNIAREAALRDPNLRLIMAGEGASRDALVAQVRDWGMADRLALPGIRNDIPALMRAADVLLFPSAQEGLGMVAVEAQAAGLPVLASTAVPIEAIVIPDLFQAIALEAPIEQWVQALCALSAKPRIDPAASRSAFASSDFSITNSAEKLEQIYRAGMSGIPSDAT